MTVSVHSEKPHAGNPHVGFDEGEVASCTAEASLRRVHCRRQPEGRASVCAATPRRGSLLCKVKMVLVTATAMLCPVAMAKTVAWYHFDEESSGTRVTGESSFLNSVDPAKYPGRFRTWIANETYWLQPSISTVPADLMPTYEDAFDRGVGVFDPVVGKFCSNATSVKMNMADPTKTYGANGTLLMIDDHEDFHLKTFTIEFFMKMSQHRISSGSYTIMGKYNGGFGSSPIVSIGMGNDGWLKASLTTIDAQEQSHSYTITQDKNKFGAVDNEKWHHIALVVDDVSKKMTLFINGVDFQTAFEGSVDYSSASAMTFGGTPCAYMGIWEGQLDEVRISDVALDKSQFLAWRAYAGSASAAFPETLFYVNFSGGLESETYNGCYRGVTYVPSMLNRGYTTTDFTVGEATITWVSGQSATTETRSLVEDTPAGNLRPGLASGTFSTNDVAFHVGTNAVNPGASIPRLDVADTNRVIESDSFTLEFFLNVGEGQINVDNAMSYLCNQSNTMYLRMEDNGCISFVDGVGKVMYFPLAWNAAHDRTNLRYNDGKWHHIALVYDKVVGRVDLFIDYVRRGWLENPNFSAAFSDSNRQLSFLGLSNSSIRRLCNTSIDEIRITRGALGPWMFLTSREVEGTALGTATYDNSLTLMPYSDFFDAPQTAAWTVAGSIPATDSAYAGSFVHDGKDGPLVRKRNRGSLRIDGGCVIYSWNGLAAEAEASTVELFVKTESVTAGAGLIRMNRASTNGWSEATWSVSFANADGDLTVGVDTDAETGATRSFGGALADGQWHHVAMVIEQTDGNTKVTVYRDYVSLGFQVFTGRLLSRFYEGNLMLGAGANSSAGFSGWIDELRISPSALSVDEFLTAENKGFSIIVR